MVTITLRSIEFFVSPVDHRFSFVLDHGDKPIAEIEVIAAAVPGGIAAVYQRGHDNLVTILEQALAQARQLAGAAAPRATPGA